ncbi:MAG: PAC2 family protein, partial [Anaerolineae bacterium]|nr:PAC2 family protein [Anaerolineae bacterium]
IYRKPAAKKIYMIAGWYQWANAGQVSSGIPLYLINRLRARVVALIKPQGFYLSQIPYLRSLLRPYGYVREGTVLRIVEPSNEFYHARPRGTGWVIFLGEEPHLNVEAYADAFLDVAQMLGVRRIVAVGGAYAPVPYDRERAIGGVVSKWDLRTELLELGVRPLDYEGAISISTYLVEKAWVRGIEFMALYAWVPAYNVKKALPEPGVHIEEDYRAWCDILRRVNDMFGLRLDLSDLEQQGEELTASMAARVEEVDREHPELGIRRLVDRIRGKIPQIRLTLTCVLTGRRICRKTGWTRNCATSWTAWTGRPGPTGLRDLRSPRTASAQFAHPAAFRQPPSPLRFGERGME